MFDPNRYVGSYQKNPENKTYNKKLAWTLKKINANKDKKRERTYHPDPELGPRCRERDCHEGHFKGLFMRKYIIIKFLQCVRTVH